MKRVYKCEYCYLKNAKPCYECSACMSGDDHFRPAKPEKKRTTNADRIRAMSDEELSEHLVDIGWECHFCTEHQKLDNEPLLCGEKCDEKCSEHCLEWLQQPAK